jgi:hypothetical protein
MTVGSRPPGHRSHRQTLRRRPAPPSAPPAQEKRPLSRKTLLAIVVPILLAFLGAGAGAIVTFVVTPHQAPRGEAALESAHDRADARNPALLVQGQRYGGEIRSAATSDVLDVDYLNQHLRESLDSSSPDLLSAFRPPGSLPVAPIQDLAPPDEVQPRVYDTVYITLVGNHYRPVKVTSITARIVSSLPPAAGTLVYAGPEGASPEESLGFDLDSPDLTARVTLPDVDTPHDTARHYFDERQITLTRFEQLELKLSVFTTTCLCSFVFDITTDDGTVITADDGGEPWQVSAFAPGYAAAYKVDVAGDARIVPCSWPEGCLHG